MKNENLCEQLLSIQIKPYEPLHSAKGLKETWKVKNEDFLKEVSKADLFSRSTTATTGRTSSTLSSIKSKRAATAISRNSKNSHFSKNNSQLSSRSSPKFQTSRPSSTTSSTVTPRKECDIDKSSEKGIPFETKFADDCSDASSNISLFSINSASTNDMNLNRTYGLFNYKSFFEQYMNGRSKFKILKSNMPKNAPDAHTEYFLYDLIENYETRKLLDIYNCHYNQINPNRAKSVNSFHPPGYDEALKLNGKNELQKAISIECIDSQYLEKKWNISKRIDNSEGKRKKLESDLKKRREFLTMEYTDSLYPTFWATDLKQPSLYEIGSRQLRKFDLLEEKYHSKKEDKLKVVDDPYEHIQSKLSAYLKDFKKNKTDPHNPKRAYTAIGIYKRGSSSFANVHKPLVRGTIQPVKSNPPPLKMTKNLNQLMREDLRLNKGPVYFAELTKENLKEKFRKVPLREKYLSLFEWLVNVKEVECQHFFDNPFVTENSTNTKISNENPESNKLQNPYENLVLSEEINDWKMNVLESSKYKIDPFINPKYDRRIRTELPKRILTSIDGKDELIDIENKRILTVTKDFTTMLNLKEKHLKNSENYQATKKDIYGRYLTKNDFLTSREKLKKKIGMNDLIKTRMTLDLFVL